MVVAGCRYSDVTRGCCSSEAVSSGERVGGGSFIAEVGDGDGMGSRSPWLGMVTEEGEVRLCVCISVVAGLDWRW